MKKRSFKKRLLNSGAARFVLSLIMSLIMRGIYATCRKEKIIPANTLPYIQGVQPAVFCFWHGRMIMQTFMKPPSRTMSVLMSHHNDGALILATMLWFDIGSVRGSKKLGGAQALRSLLEVTQRNGNISITPDGPRGPFQQAAQGAAFVAANTHYPIVSITFSATRYWRFKSWDKFMMPKPFSKIVFVASEPQHVHATQPDAVTQATQLLQAQLNAITVQADQACGVPL